MVSRNHDQLKKRLKEVCRRFLSGGTPTFADISDDELLALFDHAFDNQDYSSAWILVAIARQIFPGNDEMQLKLAYLLYVESDFDAAREVLDSLTIEPVWVATMKLLIDARQPGFDVAQSVTDIVRSAKIIDSDSLYNLMTIAQDAGLYSLIKRLMPEIEEKTRERRDFYIDMATWAENMGDREYAIELYNRLTMFAPMDDEAWVYAADFFLGDDKVNEALTAVEYALAANPKSLPGLVKKAQMMMLDSDPAKSSEGYELLMMVAENDIENEDIVNSMIWAIRNDLALDSRAESILFDYNRLHPDRIDVLNLLLQEAEARGETEIVEFLIRQFWEQNPGVSEEEWNAWVEQLKLLNAGQSAYTALKTFYELTSLTFDKCSLKASYIEMLYVFGRYEEIVDLENEIFSESLRNTVPWLILFPLVLSWARVGKMRSLDSEYRNLVVMVIKNSRPTPCLLSNLALEAAVNITSRLEPYIVKGEKLTPKRMAKLDPYLNMSDRAGNS